MVEGNGLLNRRTGDCTAGSNPALSAILFPRLIFSSSVFVAIVHASGRRTPESKVQDCGGLFPQHERVEIAGIPATRFEGDH